MVHIENSENVMKESLPVPLESGPKWQDFMPQFTNLFLYVFLVDGLPLSYVICEDKY